MCVCVELKIVYFLDQIMLPASSSKRISFVLFVLDLELFPLPFDCELDRDDFSLSGVRHFFVILPFFVVSDLLLSFIFFDFRFLLFFDLLVTDFVIELFSAFKFAKTGGATSSARLAFFECSASCGCAAG